MIAMLKVLIRTGNDRSATLLRLALGIVILPHGLQKLFGWFGGYGLSGTLGFFEQALSVPALLGFLVVLAEAAGSLGLIVGLGSRVAAAGIALVMAGAVYLVHGRFGFFMNWNGTAGGEGFEYHILAMAIALAVVVKGGGWLSLDRALARRLAEPASAAKLEPRRQPGSRAA
jgi:putative oxidoreductase